MRIVVKIFLIIALACSGATIAMLILKVEPRVKNAEEARDKNAKERDTESAAKTAALGELEKTKTDLQTTQTTLQTTQGELKAKTDEAMTAQAGKQQAEQKLSSVENEYNTWKQNHEEFVKLNRTPAQIVKTEEDLKNTTQQRDAFDKENKLLSLKVNTLDSQNIKLRDALYGTNVVVLQKGLAGKIIAVDPKYQFVILDIGNRQGVKPKGEMVVTRDGRLIAKLRIAEVATDHCVGNVLKEWSQKGVEIAEGDLVLADYKL